MQARYYSLSPSSFKLDGGAMFGIIPKPLWSKKVSADEENRILLSLRSLCIQIGKRLIVIDTGIGNYHDQKFIDQFDIKSPDNPLLHSLLKIGYHPDQVTDLILSHLHFDHVGGLGHKENGVLVPSFKNATYHIHKDHFEYAKNPTERDAGSFLSPSYLPLIDARNKEKKVHWCEGEQGTILKEDNYELKFLTSHGHTPYLMHSYDLEWIYLADLVPTSAHIHIPWVMGYDISPGITTKDKRVLLEFVIEKNLKVFFEHDPIYFGASIKHQMKNGRENYSALNLFKNPMNDCFEITPKNILPE